MDAAFMNSENSKTSVQRQDVVMRMYNLIEHSGIYLKTSGSLWKYCRDEPASNNADRVTDFTTDNNIFV